MIDELRRDIRRGANPEKAKILRGFFKTGPGHYGEGDIFLGLTVPEIRKLAKKYRETGLPDIIKLLHSPIHEERLLALLIMVLKFEDGSPSERKRIYGSYIRNSGFINSWDLVDLTADRVVGAFLSGRDKSALYGLARSKNVWRRRIAIIATFHFIKNGSADHTFAIAEILRDDRHDLIHKAVGWMLRESGKRVSAAAEEAFLKKHYRKMPRTMLRYAIERFPERKRQAYLRGRVI